MRKHVGLRKKWVIGKRKSVKERVSLVEREKREREKHTD